MLALNDLTVSYGRIPAVRGLTLEVSRGEVVGLLGANGAGKSTTLMTIAGALRPETGDIRLEGQSIVGLKPEEIVRRGIALVPEGRALFQRLTVGENLRLGLTIRSRDDDVDRDFDWVFTLFPVLKSLYRTPAGRLSGGEQQQLAIARSLLCKPRLLLLDEPTLGLAPVVIDRVFETLEELKNQGVTTLLVEQNASRTAELADRIYVMQTGRIVLEGAASEIADDPHFHEVYLGV